MPTEHWCSQWQKKHPHLRFRQLCSQEPLSAEGFLPFRLLKHGVGKEITLFLFCVKFLFFFFVFLRYEKLKPCIMGSKEEKKKPKQTQKGSCSRRLLLGEREHKLHRCGEALPACRSFSASMLWTLICSQRDLYAY